MSRRTVHALLKEPLLSRQVNGLTYDLWAGQTPADAYNTAKYRHALQSRNYEDAVHLAKRFVEVVYQKGRVIQIETNLPQFSTRSGLSAGSRLSRAAAQCPPLQQSNYSYGPPNPDTGIGYKRFYGDSVKRGIAFVLEISPHADFDPDESVTAMVVHRPAQPIRVRPHWLNRLPTEANPLSDP